MTFMLLRGDEGLDVIGMPNEADVRPEGSDPVTLCDLALEAIVGLVRRENTPPTLFAVDDGDDVRAIRDSCCWKTDVRGVLGRLKESEREIVANGRC